MRQPTRLSESSKSSTEPTKDQSKDGERAILGEPEDGTITGDGPQEVPSFEILLSPRGSLSSKSSFGTLAQGDARISQLTREEPFKGTATTKGFVQAISVDSIRAFAEGEEVVEEEWLNERLEAIFKYVSSPRLVRLGPIAAAWVFNVPEDEVDTYLSQIPGARSLGGGWWEITIDERLKPVSS